MIDSIAMAASTAANIGRRLRWLREAFERLDPLQHSQGQWANAMSIPVDRLNRYENGRRNVPLYLLSRIIYASGASANYMLFGVIEDGYMPDWLERDLIEHHRLELTPLPMHLENRRQFLASCDAPRGSAPSGLKLDAGEKK